MTTNTAVAPSLQKHTTPWVQMHNYKQQFEKQNAWGLSMNVDIYNCDPEIIRDPKAIKRYVKELLLLIDMTPVWDTIVEHFGPQEEIPGYSMMQLIETSNITAHFADLTDTGFIDIFSCKYYDPYIAAQFTQDFFWAEYSKITPNVRVTE